MIQHEVSLHLNRPVEQVFAFLVDFQNVPRWQSNLVEIEQLTEGALQAGTQFREVRRFGRRASEIWGELTEFELNKRFVTKTLTKPQVTVSFSLDPEDGGTRLGFKFVLVTSGLMRLFEPWIDSLINKQRESDFATLKCLLES